MGDYSGQGDSVVRFCLDAETKSGQTDSFRVTGLFDRYIKGTSIISLEAMLIRSLQTDVELDTSESSTKRQPPSIRLH